ncbi:MAG: zinc ribbon domain-containing protein [Clostridiales bacterium]|uniref:zinc ribbon domain-containing protein n=1 Tax=Clostridium sp. N3C TaxID=1776758 RepID=UPI0011777261|nr:zinc ribbon domain-containing protein [Clostridium sp. N3C]NLZ49717.1 zinc ribbon domain-containing protein [Clostridiales bacterium]
MDCKRCGALVPEGSLFCNKCGNRLEGVNKFNLNKNYSSTDYQSKKDKSSDYSNSAYNMKLHNYPRRTNAVRILMFLIMVMVIVAVGGIFAYSKYRTHRISKVKSLFEEGNYRDLVFMLDDITELDQQDEEFKTIAYTSDYGYTYQSYEEEMKKEYPNYQFAIQYLFDGLERCNINEKLVEDPIEKDIVSSFKEKHTSALKNEFGLSQEEIKDVLKLNYEARNEKYIEIAYKYIQKKSNN